MIICVCVRDLPPSTNLPQIIKYFVRVCLTSQNTYYRFLSVKWTSMIIVTIPIKIIIILFLQHLISFKYYVARVNEPVLLTLRFRTSRNYYTVLTLLYIGVILYYYIYFIIGSMDNFIIFYLIQN